MNEYSKIALIFLSCFILNSKQCLYIKPENAGPSEQPNVTAYKIFENVESNIRCALLCKTAANGICKSVKLVIEEKKCFLYKELMNGKIHIYFAFFHALVKKYHLCQKLFYNYEGSEFEMLKFKFHTKNNLIKSD